MGTRKYIIHIMQLLHILKYNAVRMYECLYFHIINVYLWVFSRTFYFLCVIFSSSERTLLVKGQLISECIFGRNDVFIKSFRFLLTFSVNRTTLRQCP